MNRLLAALPKDDYRSLEPLMEPVRLDLMQPLYEPGRPIRHIYFPTDSIISLTLSAEGGIVEVAMIGVEGVVGLPAVFGAKSCPWTAICQQQGEVMGVETQALRRAAEDMAPLRAVLHRYAAYLQVQSFYSTACNRLHGAEQRLCRWLLMTHDRAGADEFPMTHEFLSRMLGVRRPTVSLIAGAVQEAGLIRYVRGKLVVLDRAGLESAACGCYAAVRQEQARLLGESSARVDRPARADVGRRNEPGPSRG